MSLNYKKLEKVVKGFANHRRLEVIELLSKYPNLSVDQISQNLDVNFATISDHVRKLADAGIVEKRYKGQMVLNKLTKKGKDIMIFCKILE